MAKSLALERHLIFACKTKTKMLCSAERTLFYSKSFVIPRVKGCGRADKRKVMKLYSKAKMQVFVTICENYLESPDGRILDQICFCSANQNIASFTNVCQVRRGSS